MKKFTIIVLSLILLVGLLSSFVYFLQGDQTKPSDTPQMSEQLVQFNGKLRNDIGIDVIDEVDPQVSRATISGVGDLLIAISIITDARQADGTYNFKPMFEHVKPYISNADIAFANQETILGGEELGLSGFPLFNSPYEVGDAVIDTGFDVLSIANNHTLDMGEQGVLNAIDYYNSTELIYTGAYKSEEDRATIRTMKENGITFSFLAYSYGTNGLPIPGGKDYLINLIDVDIINEDIIAAKEVSDIVVLSLHFGNEYELMPNETQKMLVQEFSNTGADIIFGHHPHVLQPMEWVEREDGSRTFVAYSLGNFLSGQVGIEREIGGIVQLEVEKTAFRDEVSFQLKDPRFLPTFTYKQNWRQYKIYPLHEIDDDRILKNADEYLQNTKQHVSQWMPELKFSFE